MAVLTEWLSGAAGAWIPFMADVALKSAVLLLAALVATLALRGSSASVRHHVWTLAFAAVLALPVLAGTLPSWRVTVPGWPVATRDPEVAPPAAAAPTASRPLTVAPDGRRSEAPIASGSGAGALPPGVSTTVRPVAPSIGSVWRLGPLIWLAGALLFLTRLMVGVVSAWWTSRVAAPLEDAGWKRTIAQLKETLGIPGEVRVRVSPWVGTPMAWGILRPALLLPCDALAWSSERRRAVALHELAHVKRRDCLVHLLAQATRAVHWMNPLAWIGARRLRAERERACDDMVLTAGTRSADYARLLLDVARARGDRRLARAAVSMARPSELEGRLLAILDPARDRRGLGRVRSLVACIAVTAAVLPLAAFQAAPTGLRSEQDAGKPPIPSVVPPSDTGSSHLEELSAARSIAVPRIVTDPRPRPEVATGPHAAPPSAAGPDAAPWQEVARPAVTDTTDERFVAVMVRALHHESADFRRQAAQTLGTMESPLAVEPLGAAIQDPDAGVRSKVAWALGMIESPDGVPALTIAIRDENAEVRSQAAWALGMIESRDGVEPLLVALDDDSESVRSQAAWALGMIESSSAVEGLIVALRSDASAHVRSQAAWALGMIQDRSAADALVDALEDESEEVAKQAMWALGMVIG